MWLNYDLRPSLRPDAAERQRYTRFLGAAATTNKHIEFDAKDRYIKQAFRHIRIFDFKERLRSPKNRLSPASDIVWQMLNQEVKILDPSKPWLGSEGVDNGRQQRVAARIATGRASFVYWYGRDQQPTGWKEFDHMYDEAWGLIQDQEHAADGWLAPLVASHAAVVDAAIANHQAASQAVES